ncbi:hypothetical protein VN97_g12025 [Penicillium thymicola]|uniref:Uncharacterized protein n=1 Tax=Penicillium thymicola TaxID=293382 RepID=A0AAI9X2E0_PENTH|nr:hypothetical protein VN97_g12025 [Penicillium thymicola]
MEKSMSNVSNGRNGLFDRYLLSPQLDGRAPDLSFTYSWNYSARQTPASTSPFLLPSYIPPLTNPRYTIF